MEDETSMAFASAFSKINTYGKYKEAIYTFTGATGDTGGTIATIIKTIVSITASGELADGSANVLALSVGETANDGEIRLTYTNPAADHTGIAIVRGMTR